MEADFSGWATKSGVLCTDGRTIMHGAFKEMDKVQVPLVWQHGHKDPENVLGHVILEHRDEGVYAYGFFNDTPKAKHTKTALAHKDFNMMSIWANQLVERAKQVFHGAIREVSLVLSGANPGAVIESVSIRHADGEIEEKEEEAVIRSGEPIILAHSDEGNEEKTSKGDKGAEGNDDVDDKDLIEQILHAADDLGDDATVADVYESLNDKQKDLFHFALGEVMESKSGDNSGGDAEHSNDDKEGTGETMHSNVFDQDGKTKGAPEHVLSHADLEGIVADATKTGSLKEAVEMYAEKHLEHGIEDIDQLFPDARSISDSPEFLKRDTGWVGVFFGGARKSPFARIKTFSADLTFEQARAKGYVKGNLKKEEFFPVAKRVTTPTTVYKKQKLDRDDMVDITDFDVVAWLKGEMRLMLDEEIARAGLLGDGRDIASDDKIPETSIRPIASDHELFTTVVNVNLDNANSSVQEIIDAVVLHRKDYKGTGTPIFFTTETYIAQFMLLKDTTGRRIYRSLDELAAELRVSAVVPVEPMEEYDDIVGVLVNPIDYSFGADKGGNVSMFEDFDIDYNQHKYLIETRCSGALTKLKSAIVVKKVAGADILVVPAMPDFDAEAGEVTITNQTGVVYKDGAGTTINAGGSPYSVDPGETYVVNATPAAGYYFGSSNDDSWSFTADE